MGDAFFFSKNGRCSIHAFKSETCGSGPFTFDMNGDRIALYLQHELICPIVGLIKEVPEAYRHQYELVVQSIMQLVKNLTEKELRAICAIEKPETDKVAEIPWAW
ncbi:MAG: hypothetical protein WCF90_05430 [Methanomicrobiales archaeon]